MSVATYAGMGNITDHSTNGAKKVFLSVHKEEVRKNKKRKEKKEGRVENRKRVGKKERTRKNVKTRANYRPFILDTWFLTIPV